MLSVEAIYHPVNYFFKAKNMIFKYSFIEEIINAITKYEDTVIIKKIFVVERKK